MTRSGRVLYQLRQVLTEIRLFRAVLSGATAAHWTTSALPLSGPSFLRRPATPITRPVTSAPRLSGPSFLRRLAAPVTQRADAGGVPLKVACVRAFAVPSTYCKGYPTRQSCVWISKASVLLVAGPLILHCARQAGAC